MKKFIKNNLKVFIAIIITLIISSTISICAYNYYAKDISFIPDNESWEVDNVEDTINSLYKNSKFDFSNSELLYSRNQGLNFTDSYTFDGRHDKIILFLWAASRDNNVSLSYSMSSGNIVYDKLLSTYHDTYTQGRIVIIDNVEKGTVLNFSLYWQPGIFVYGL